MKAFYVATEAYANLPANRINLVQTLDFFIDKLTEASIPEEVEDFAIARVGDNSDIEVTVFGSGPRTMSVKIGYADDDRWPFYNELHRSTRKGERFFIEPGTIRGHMPGVRYECHRTSTSPPTHFDHCRGIKYEFTVEILNA